MKTTASDQAVKQPAWYALSLVDVLALLQTTVDGLTVMDAQGRLAEAGPNAIPRAPALSAWRVLLTQFQSVVVLLLVAGCAVALLTGDLADTIAIAAVLVLNVGIGFAMEIRAHRAVEALTRLEARRATVVREGLPREIDARELVPGDILVLEAGQSVPADARLLAGTELRVVEATLTGESVPVSKHADAPVEVGASLPERLNVVYAGTSVTSGTGRAVVVATGASTELGNIGRLVDATEIERTPLERRLDALGRQLVWIALLVGGATGALAWIHNAPASVVLQAAIALAVAAVPEGLPAVATITLALGVHRMARRRALVRRLPSVETLGAVTVLCTDKTGTLTAGAMTVTELRVPNRQFRVSGTAYDPAGAFFLQEKGVAPQLDSDLMLALRIGATVNRADAVLTDTGWVARGDPTEAALTVAARKAGIERADIVRDFPEVGEVPFSSERKLMATFHRAAAVSTIAYVKGAPSRVLELCSHVQINDAAVPLDAVARDMLVATNHNMAERGLRVLALAYGTVVRPEESALEDLTFVGLVGMSDPPAPGVRDAIRAFQDAGIATVMITGDQAGTAQAIARDLGLTMSAEALDGRHVDAMPDDELQARLPLIAVFSRVSPEAKLRIVSGYQKRGDVVAMIGDGVNDAAALKKADVGVTMGGRGTDVARETAAVVLEDDRFETIGVAIEEGRIVFDNIRKFVFYLFSCNLAEIFVLLGSSAIGLPLPLEPIQVLWLNLVTDTAPALTLALEPGEPGVMRRPPRDPASAIVSGPFMKRIALYALLIAASTFIVIAWSRLAGIPDRRAVTMNFMVLAFAQLFHLGNARDERPVVRPQRAFANPAALAAVAIVIALQLVAVYVGPVADLLHVEPLTGLEWALVVGASIIPGVIGQAVKGVRGGAIHVLG